ncbi:MAG TPA: Calx-beta domain-containing protein [Pyrinomonadaceae bacterium]|jgi:hypothetical protein
MAHMLYRREAAAPAHRRLLTLALFAVMAFAAIAVSPSAAAAQTQGSPDLVISQVYTRGGEPGATYRNDFIELFNRSNAAVDLNNYIFQVVVNSPSNPPNAISTVTIRFVTAGGTFMAPGAYRLFRFGSRGEDGAPVGGSDFSDLNLPGGTGRIALIKGAGAGTPTNSFVRSGCAAGVDPSLADFFSYGPDICAEGGANFPAPTVTTAALRNNDGCNDTDAAVSDFTNAAPNPRTSQTAAHLCNLTAPASTFQFEADTASVNEGVGSAEIFVTRTGDTSAPASVQYATSDGTASDHTDYTTAFGTLDFAAGETRKSFRVLVTDDVRPESIESLSLTLNYPTGGAGLGARHISALAVSDNDTGTLPSPIDQTDFFVRQHYADFLSREPDTDGFNFWRNEIEGCGADAQCREVKRINVSAAFFLSIEFQDTGFFAYRAYKAAFPNTSQRQRGFPLYRELFHDAQRIGQGVVVGRDNWEQQLAANKAAYALEFVTRPEFLIRYPASQTPAQFVDALNATAGSPLSQAERDQQVADLTAAGNNASGRAAVLAAVVEDTDFRTAEFNRAFVLMQYFGYMRRNPNDPPDATFDGYSFWLGKMIQFNGNYIAAEMVKAFISSDEYRNRFK